jgi:hypothetical protein
VSRPRNYDRERDRRAGRAAFLARSAPSCGTCGKKRYPSRKLARAVARILYPGTRMRAYPCGGEFHLTSQDADRAALERKLEALGRGVPA